MARKKNWEPAEENNPVNPETEKETKNPTPTSPETTTPPKNEIEDLIKQVPPEMMKGLEGLLDARISNVIDNHTVIKEQTAAINQLLTAFENMAGKVEPVLKLYEQFSPQIQAYTGANPAPAEKPNFLPNGSPNEPFSGRGGPKPQVGVEEFEKMQPEQRQTLINKGIQQQNTQEPNPLMRLIAEIAGNYINKNAGNLLGTGGGSMGDKAAEGLKYVGELSNIWSNIVSAVDRARPADPTSNLIAKAGVKALLSGKVTLTEAEQKEAISEAAPVGGQSTESTHSS